MTPLLDPMTRHAYVIGIVRIAVVALVVLAAVVVASIAFGWNLASGPSFELTTNPGVDLPF